VISKTESLIYLTDTIIAWIIQHSVCNAVFDWTSGWNLRLCTTWTTQNHYNDVCVCGRKGFTVVLI